MSPVRPAVGNDLPAAAQLWHAEQVEVYGEASAVCRPEDIFPFFRDVVMSASDSIWVIEDGSVLRAMMALNLDSIAHLYVHPAVRRRGLGSRLIAHAKSLAPAGLSVHTTLRVAPFYARHGFLPLAASDWQTEVDLEWRP